MNKELFEKLVVNSVEKTGKGKRETVKEMKDKLWPGAESLLQNQNLYNLKSGNSLLKENHIRVMCEVLKCSANEVLEINASDSEIEEIINNYLNE